MKKLKFLFAAVFLILGFSCTKLSANPIDYNNAIGFYGLGGEVINNYGIQYQHWFNDVVGFSAEGMLSYLKDSYQAFYASVNAEVDFQLFKTRIRDYSATRLYAFFEGGYHGFSKSSSWNSTAGKYENIQFYHNVLLALGFTFEFDFFEHVSIPIKFGIDGEFPNNTGAGMIVGSGVRFLF